MKLLALLLLLLLAWTVWRGFSTGRLPQPGGPAADFRLADQTGQSHQLSDYAGKWRIVFFYPRDDTPGCTKEACSIRDGLVRLQAMGAVVMGISVDDVASHRRFAEKFGLNFPLLADTDGSVSRQYGVLMDWKAFRMAKRVTFLIDPAGVIRAVFPRVEPATHAEEILVTLQEQVSK